MLKSHRIREKAVKEINHIIKNPGRTVRVCFSHVNTFFKHFGNVRGAEASATLSYYALFSIFPLILLVIAAGGHILERRMGQEQLIETVVTIFPVAQDMIRRNVTQVLSSRGSISVLGLLTLAWSATAYFHTLINNINRAWAKSRMPSYVRTRLGAFGIVVGTIVALVISIIFSTVLRLFSQYRVPLFGGVSLYQSPLWKLVVNYLPFVVRFAMFWLMYDWVPNRKVKKRAAVVGAIFSTVAWELLTKVFTWYIGSGLVNYELVYGSLGAIVVLMFYFFLTNMIFLLGANLTAFMDQHQTQKSS